MPVRRRGDQNCAILIFEADLFRLPDSLGDCVLLDRLTRPIELVEFLGDRPRFGDIRGHQKPRAERGVANPSAGIDPGADEKSQMPRLWRSLEAGNIEQRGQARTRALAHHRKTLAHEGAVQPGQGERHPRLLRVQPDQAHP